MVSEPENQTEFLKCKNSFLWDNLEVNLVFFSPQLSTHLVVFISESGVCAVDSLHQGRKSTVTLHRFYSNTRKSTRLKMLSDTNKK